MNNSTTSEASEAVINNLIKDTVAEMLVSDEATEITSALEVAKEIEMDPDFGPDDLLTNTLMTSFNPTTLEYSTESISDIFGPPEDEDNATEYIIGSNLTEFPQLTTEEGNETAAIFENSTVSTDTSSTKEANESGSLPIDVLIILFTLIFCVGMFIANYLFRIYYPETVERDVENGAPSTELVNLSKDSLSTIPEAASEGSGQLYLSPSIPDTSDTNASLNKEQDTGVIRKTEALVHCPPPKPPRPPKHAKVSKPPKTLKKKKYNQVPFQWDFGDNKVEAASVANADAIDADDLTKEDSGYGITDAGGIEKNGSGDGNKSAGGLREGDAGSVNKDDDVCDKEDDGNVKKENEANEKKEDDAKVKKENEANEKKEDEGNMEDDFKFIDE